MQSRQRHPSTKQNRVSPVPRTLWQRLPPSSQQQLAHLIADLVRRARTAAQDKESTYEC
jgi:hypothetical protein